MVSVTLPSVRLPGDWYQSVLILVEGLPGNRIRAAADWSDDDDGTGDGDGGGSRRGDRGGRRSGAAPQSASTVRRHELAAFLRHRREHITPEQVGLPRGTRRRTPGLRREEVAQLAAVGVTWYTWLEQARDIQVSVQVLDALARTLFLDSSERAHLFQLAGAIDPQPATSCAVVTPALQAMLDQLDPIPACLQNSRYDILAYNRTYGMLLCDLDAVPRRTATA